MFGISAVFRYIVDEVIEKSQQEVATASTEPRKDDDDEEDVEPVDPKELEHLKNLWETKLMQSGGVTGLLGRNILDDEAGDSALLMQASAFLVANSSPPKKRKKRKGQSSYQLNNSDLPSISWGTPGPCDSIPPRTTSQTSLLSRLKGKTAAVPTNYPPSCTIGNGVKHEMVSINGRPTDFMPPKAETQWCAVKMEGEEQKSEQAARWKRAGDEYLKKRRLNLAEKPPSDIPQFDGLNDFVEVEELDSEDDEGIEEPQTQNLVLCQYEKITRSKNKWRCQLKDGIMTLNGLTYLFSKADGEVDF